MIVPLNKPYIGSEELWAVKEVLDTGMVSSGEVVADFEESVKRYVGAKYAVAVSSATAGLFLVMNNALKFQAAIPAFTFPAAQLVCETIWPRAVRNIEVEKPTYNIDTAKLRTRLESRDQKEGDVDDVIESIIPIHQFGLPCDMDEINRIASEKELFVLEDAACALGSEYKGEKIGRRGTAVFSFHGRKIVTTGEGGMVVTNDEEIYESVLHGRNYGRNHNGDFVSSGLNFKLSNIAAAIGIEQMKKIDEIIKKRDQIAELYGEKIREMNPAPYIMGPIYSGKCVWIPGHRNEFFEGSTTTNWQSYVVRLQGVDRDQVMCRMRRNGIECQIGSYDNSNGRCPVSAELAKTTLALPIWPGMTTAMIERVVEQLTLALRET